MSLDIRVNGISLNLFPNEQDNFYITKQLHDLRDLETRNASFTKELTVPNAGINSSLLRQYLPQFASQNQSEITYTSVDVLMGGVPIITDALLFSSKYSRNEKEITITIFGGEQDFFNQLSDDLISDLFDESIPWNIANLNSNADNTTFWVYPNLVWYSNESYERFNSLNTTGANQGLEWQDIELSGIVIYSREIWDRIMAKLIGLTVDMSWDTSLLDVIGVAAPVYQLLNSYSRPVGSLSAVTLPNNTPPLVTDFVVGFATIVTDDNGNWDAGNNRFVVANSGNAKIVLELIISVAPQQNVNNQTNKVVLLKNGTPLRTWDIIAGRDDHIFELIQYSEISNLLVGDIIEVQATTQSVNDGSPFKFSYSSDGKFQLLFGEPIDNILISEILPDIKQKDFIKSILQLMHLIPVTNDKVVSFNFWEDIPTKEADILNSKVAVDRPIKESNLISSYGQNNHFKYADDGNVLRTDMNAVEPSKIRILQPDKTLIQLLYSACDESFISTEVNGINGRASIPAFDFEYKEITGNNIALINGSVNYTTSSDPGFTEGDVIAVNDGGFLWRRARIATISDETTGTLTYPWIGTSLGHAFQLFRYGVRSVNSHLLFMTSSTDTMRIGNSGEITNINAQNRKAAFDSQLLWNNLIINYYQIFVDSIEKPFVVQLWIYLRVQEFNKINSLTPIWIEEFADYFYLNKIEQYKQNKLTRIELIRIKN